MKWWLSLPPHIRTLVYVRGEVLYADAIGGTSIHIPASQSSLQWPSDSVRQSHYCRAYLELMEFTSDQR
jgi:hypothetical protein